MTTQQLRGSFPKGPADETPEQKRLRYEQWVIETHTQAQGDRSRLRTPDPEYDAIKAQSLHWGKPGANSKTASRVLSIRARCWQCVGSEDEGALQRISQCPSTSCALWSVRPHQDAQGKTPNLPTSEVDKSGIKNFDHLGKALANPGNRIMAVKGYCHECKGGGLDHKTRQAVWSCADAACALWFIKAKRCT
ncbi:MAG: hypothetical protein I8H71_11325 [Xanthomonadaceae bacterium]|nr:hypothetical protein [Xanthomonadaceae bacterium]